MQGFFVLGNVMKLTFVLSALVFNAIYFSTHWLHAYNYYRYEFQGPDFQDEDIVPEEYRAELTLAYGPLPQEGDSISGSVEFIANSNTNLFRPPYSTKFLGGSITLTDQVIAISHNFPSFESGSYFEVLTNQFGVVDEWSISLRENQRHFQLYLSKDQEGRVSATEASEAAIPSGPNSTLYISLGKSTEKYAGNYTGNRWQLVEEFNVAPEHLIILTHGFQPGKVYNNSRPYLPEVQNAIEDRLSDEIAEGNVYVMPFNWQGAFQTSLDDYSTAYSNSFTAGTNLANDVAQYIYSQEQEIKSFFPDAEPYRPTIHLIGHSLGTIVNAQAVNVLNDIGIPVTQVTMLDTPLAASGRVVSASGIKGEFRQQLATYDSALLYWTLMPENSVQYVENYYADPTLRNLFDPAFGQPIAGASPCIGTSCSGLKVTGVGHNSLQSIFYAGVANSNSSQQWSTPALGVQPDTIWHPDTIRQDFLDSFNDLTEFDAFQIIVSVLNPVTGDSFIIDAMQRELGTIAFFENSVRATSNSPSAFSANAHLDTVIGVEFDLEVLGAQTGMVFLSIDGEEVWQIDLSNLGLNPNKTVYVSLMDYIGTHKLQWTYDSSEIGTSVLFKNIAFHQVTAIPEPGSQQQILAALSITLIISRPSRKS